MKNTLKKIAISTLIAVSAATATIAPAATTVMANSCIEARYNSEGEVFFYNPETNKYYYADGSGIHYCDENGVLKQAQSTQKSSTQKASVTLDKTLYGQTRYANVSDFLALRTGPSTDNEMIAKLAPNAQVTIIGQAGNWVKVYAPSVDRDGYVSANYLSKTKAASTSKSSSEKASSKNKSSSDKAAYGDATYKKVFGTTNYLALRTATKYDDANEIAKLHDGDQVQVIEYNVNGSGYAKVYAPSVGMTGYVNRVC